MPFITHFLYFHKIRCRDPHLWSAVSGPVDIIGMTTSEKVAEIELKLGGLLPVLYEEFFDGSYVLPCNEKGEKKKYHYRAEMLLF